jgi:hypothetical protein
MDYINFILDLIKWVKLPPVIVLFITSLISGFLVFSKTEYREYLKIGIFIEQYYPWIFLIFCVSTILFLTLLMLFLIGIYLNKKNIDKKFNSLTPNECQILLVLLELKALRIPDLDNATMRLEHENFISRIPGSYLLDFHGNWTYLYVLESWALDYLKKHKGNFPTK